MLLDQLAPISVSGRQGTHRGMCATYLIDTSCGGAALASAWIPYNAYNAVARVQHTQPPRACPLPRVQIYLARKTSRKLAVPLKCALLERSGQSHSCNPQRPKPSIETKLYRMMGIDLAGLASCALTFCTKHICACDRRRGTRQGV